MSIRKAVIAILVVATSPALRLVEGSGPAFGGIWIRCTAATSKAFSELMASMRRPNRAKVGGQAERNTVGGQAERNTVGGQAERDTGASESDDEGDAAIKERSGDYYYDEISVGHVLVASDRSNGGTRRAPGILCVLCEDYKTERRREDYAPFDQGASESDDEGDAAIKERSGDYYYDEISVGHVLVASDRSNGGTRRAPGILCASLNVKPIGASRSTSVE
ncbi:hypothetical protein PLICRDRAFT_179329 [Plicaturopsis crispa FD-325 SS-3]|uniref:Uncharacterized protein n=1 Tax=Plicaturopsis crispa FD-325 SS-3 TaxID=944288 RepID=A0A0C9SRA3_PLICR|nr:hypothetical protein PLICRDRAFT_179329 [Plicaturopsis crispa FD-325 SS-3]